MGMWCMTSLRDRGACFFAVDTYWIKKGAFDGSQETEEKEWE